MKNLNKTIIAFKKDVKTTYKLFNQLIFATSIHPQKNKFQEMLVEQFVMSLAVKWESFISELILDYISKDPSVFFKRLKVEVTGFVQSKFKKGVLGFLKFNISKKMTKDEVGNLLDPEGKNISFQDSVRLTEFANRNVAAKHAKNFSFAQEDGELIDLLIKMRNYLGHRSKGSLSLLRENVKKIKKQGKNLVMSGSLKSISSYLIGNDPTIKTKFIVDRLCEIADKL